MITGVVSVTFRELKPLDIIKLTKESGLNGIEWGSDIHCPPDNAQAASEIFALMTENGLSSISYGSYYQVGSFGRFDHILNTTVKLGAKNIRVWAGDTASIESGADVWKNVTEDSQRIADMAFPFGITISYEYHNDTLTDNLESVLLLINRVKRGNVYTYWQPPINSDVEDNLKSIQKLVKMKKLKNLHIFTLDGLVRLPLDAGIWIQYVREASPCEPALLLEFVKGNSIQQFLDDAKALIKLNKIL
jgi:3-dehydroshikimate dehydratase